MNDLFHTNFIDLKLYLIEINQDGPSIGNVHWSVWYHPQILLKTGLCKFNLNHKHCT